MESINNVMWFTFEIDVSGNYKKKYGHSLQLTKDGDATEIEGIYS